MSFVTMLLKISGTKYFLFLSFLPKRLIDVHTKKCIIVISYYYFVSTFDFVGWTTLMFSRHSKIFTHAITLYTFFVHIHIFSFGITH